MTATLANDLTLAAGILQAGCTCTGISISRMRTLVGLDETAETWHLYTIVQAMRSSFITWQAMAEVFECDLPQVTRLIKIISDRDYYNRQVMFRVASQIYAENATAPISRA
jgi:hypothetical protein